MKICYFGTYREEYARNRIMIAGLREAGAQVIECHEPFWRGNADRIRAVQGGWASPNFIFRLIKAYCKLVWRGLRLPDYDVLVCGYPGHFDVFLARILTWLRRRPLVWDVLLSIYLVSLERGLDKGNNISMRLLRFFEQKALSLPELLILESREYVKWFGNTYGTPADRFRLVPVGADDRIFQPVSKELSKTDLFTVLYYGTFIPNHGVSYIIQAANLLKNDSQVQFIMIGEGPDLPSCQEQVNRFGLNNVRFIHWMPQSELVKYITQADVLLGAFGKTPHSVMTVHNKIIEGLAMARPVITAQSSATSAVFTHKKNIWHCDRNEPSSLVEAIVSLRADPDLRMEIARNGRILFEQRYTIRETGRVFLESLRAIKSR